MLQTVLGRLGSKPAASSAAQCSSWVGVVGADDPACALRGAGHTAVWDESGTAFGGPVAQDCRGTVVVCGDIVLDNAAELRRSLELPQASPGELFAELFKLHGAQTVCYARGMYAAAVWQRDKRKLTLLRDAVGARNIYYSVSGSAAWFATSLRALRHGPSVSSNISLSALRNYLSCAYVPGAETMWQDVLEVRPGSAVSLPDGRCEIIWTPQECDWDAAEPLDESAARLRPLLEDAVRICIPPGEPVGVFLSGGLDSSLVTALAAQFSSSPVHTYAIHFGSQYRNELEFSGMVAEHCRTRHHIIELTGRQIADNITASIAALDDPIGDPLTTPNLILGRAAARDVGTILNGEGGDPCFGGPKNLPMLLHELYAESGRTAAYLRAYQKCYDDLGELLTPEAHHMLKGCAPQEAMFEPYLGADANMKRYLNRLMLMNTVFKGADHILTKVNNLTQANGLLGRSPLFDRRIVEASFAIPPAHKQSGAIEKAVLKRAVVDLLPEAILARPKSGMLVPVQAWFKQDLKRMARGMLLSRKSRIRPYIRQEVVREWLAYRGSFWPRHGVKLWLLLTLEIWLRENE